jgi:hypothetical protein
MSDVLRVQWTIIPQTAPQPWLSCNRCGGPRRFQTSGKIRVNANGKRLDAWLIYRCVSCGNTWNRPILERQHVRTIDPQFLMALRANEPALVRRLAFDVEQLKRRAGRVEEFDDVRVIKDVLAENTMPMRRLEILCAVPEPTGLRVDRLLASELHVSRSWIRRLEKAEELVVLPEGSRLRRTVRDGTRLVMTLSAASDSSIARAAKSVRNSA